MRTLALVLVAAALALLACGDSPDAAGKPKANRFNSGAAWRLLKWQVELGPRPAGSPASRRLARRFRRLLPQGRSQSVPGGLRNVVGRVPGRSRSYVVVGAHYDTKDIPGFVGANDGASGTAVVTQLARTIKPRRLRKTIVFVLFDGEESPAGTPDSEFEEKGLRGSRVAARRYRRARSMILLDFVGERGLRIPRESYSNPRLWRKLRRAARRVGAGSTFPAATQSGILDDHIPFRERGIPSIDLIDFDFDCWHRTCDDLDVISRRSLDAVGESVYELLRRL
jgi:glutaminyl-peptide cyclotransferase